MKEFQYQGKLPFIKITSESDGFYIRAICNYKKSNEEVRGETKFIDVGPYKTKQECGYSLIEQLAQENIKLDDHNLDNLFKATEIKYVDLDEPSKFLFKGFPLGLEDYYG